MLEGLCDANSEINRLLPFKRNKRSTMIDSDLREYLDSTRALLQVFSLEAESA